MVSHYEVLSNSMIAILDKALRKANLKPEYDVQTFLDEQTNLMKKGLILKDVKGEKIDLRKSFPPQNLHKLGILGFVNGVEPGDGSIPLHEIMPKQNDILSLAYIEQGKYRGDFLDLLAGKKIVGVEPLLLRYKVSEEDLKNPRTVSLK